jgi:hypothetical protein
MYIQTDKRITYEYSTVSLVCIVVYGLRHSSTNFKISISDGDFKAIQGDFSWASIQMVEHYSHFEGDRRRQLNTKFEEQFYG